MHKAKEEELQNREKDLGRLKMEVKKLQKIKEFKHTMIKKENPGAEFKEISNILGVKRKTVSAEEKKPYEGNYQAEKQAYLKVIRHEKRKNEAMKLWEKEQKHKTTMELLEQYIQFKQEAKLKNKKKKTRKRRVPMKPKHPISAYFLFARERQSSLVGESKNFLEVAKIIGQE